MSRIFEELISKRGFDSGFLKPKYLSDKKNISVLLAYGDNVSKLQFLQKYKNQIIDIFTKHGATFYHLGDLTKKGNPRHIKPQNISQLPITSPLIKH